MPVELYVGIASGAVVCGLAKLLKVHKVCYERNKEIESAEREESEDLVVRVKRSVCDVVSADCALKRPLDFLSAVRGCRPSMDHVPYEQAKG